MKVKSTHVNDASHLLRALALGTMVALALPGHHALAADTAAQGTAGLTKVAGYVPFWFDGDHQRVLLQVPALDTDVLYYVSAATGPGSVEAGFDRGIINSMVVHFVRSGGKVVVEQINLDYRALNGSAATKQGVVDSFPTSVLASLPIVSESGGMPVVDATALFMRDAGHVAERLKRAGQGDFKFDAARSVFYPKRMKAFPENTEIETIATFTSDKPGRAMNEVTPDPGVMTIHIHHSFLKAPTGYTPREADPRIGVSSIKFKDFSKPIDDSPVTEWISRWRLEKKDPGAALSEPVKPIVYYFDPAIPDPIRHACEEGLLWWNKAFEKAGFKNAIEAKDAPPDMDPMDIRYAYVMWIQRDQRGFSSSGNYRDPRTGETLGSKTHLDTYRVRTVANYYDAYSGGLPKDGSGITIADPNLVSQDKFNAMLKGQRDMAFLRQALLAAHELGHTLGFQHNWNANLNNMSSVMEYPSPRVMVKNGKLDLSDSFMKAVGAYDDYMVRYAYTPFPKGKEQQGLDDIITDMHNHGIVFTLPSDPRYAWYDDRATPAEAMKETAAVRKIALANYGPDMLKPGEPIGAMRDIRLWMVYLNERYAIESAQRYIGGMFQNIVVKGEEKPLKPTEFIPAGEQREIMDLLMDAVKPANLKIPESLLIQLAPDPSENLEDLSDDAVFDQLKAARILSALVIEPLFEADRAKRMVALGARKPDTLTFPQMVDQVMAATWGMSPSGDSQEKALLRVSQSVAMQSMMALGGAANTAPEARDYVLEKLGELGDDLKARSDADPLTQAFYRQSAKQIAHYLTNPAANVPKNIMPVWGKGPRSRFPQPPGPPL
ncbi:MAG: zinc-dependent metalloprotease [Alphaproteobacteria bacterium]|nr:zinc-dependent metalloprotease [Alphaproteobacteria bacterium]